MKKFVSLLLVFMLSVSMPFTSFANSMQQNNGYEAPDFEYEYIDNRIILDDNISLFDTLPQAYNNDLDNLKYVSPVKNQGNEGLCWTFSANSVLETALLKKYNETDNNKYDMSEIHISYSVSKSDENSNYDNPLGFIGRNATGNNSAGNFKRAQTYWVRNKTNGSATEENAPYSKRYSTVDELNAVSKEDFYTTNILTLANLSDNPTVDEIQNRIMQVKNMVLNYGSASVIYYSDDSLYYKDSITGTYGYYCSSKNTTNHVVTIVGWDDTYTNDSWGTQAGTGAFIVKNSWGEDWGNKGYFYMSYNCKDYFRDIYTISDISNRSDLYDNIYEYDYMGMNSTIGYSNTNKSSYSNKFTTDNNKEEVLTAMSTYILLPNCQYKFYYSSSGEFSDLTELNISNLGQKGENGYSILDAGYITAEFETPVTVKGDYAVAVEVYNPYYKISNKTIPLESDTSTVLCQATQKGYLSPSIDNLKQNRYNNATQYDICLKAFTKNKTYNITFVENGNTVSTKDVVPSNAIGELPNGQWCYYDNELSAYIKLSEDTIINNDITAYPLSEKTPLFNIVGYSHALSNNTKYIRFVSEIEDSFKGIISEVGILYSTDKNSLYIENQTVSKTTINKESGTLYKQLTGYTSQEGYAAFASDAIEIISGAEDTQYFARTYIKYNINGNEYIAYSNVINRSYAG